MDTTLVQAHDINGDLLWEVSTGHGWTSNGTKKHLMRCGYTVDQMRPYMDFPMLRSDYVAAKLPVPAHIERAYADAWAGNPDTDKAWR